MHKVPARSRALILALSLGLSAPLAGAAGLALTAHPAAAATSDPVAVLAAGALFSLRDLQAVRQDPAQADLFADDDPALGALADRYTQLRTQLAQAVAARAGVDPAALDAAWQSVSEARLTVVLTALGQVGVPYRYARSEPGVGFDCSGLTSYAWSAAGVGLAHQDAVQRGQSARVAAGSALPGDLVFFPGHVMLYLGVGDAIVHAPHTGTVVTVGHWSRVSAIGDPAPTI